MWQPIVDRVQTAVGQILTDIEDFVTEIKDEVMEMRDEFLHDNISWEESDNSSEWDSDYFDDYDELGE